MFGKKDKFSSQEKLDNNTFHKECHKLPLKPQETELT